jgi:hypothetical protein
MIARDHSLSHLLQTKPLLITESSDNYELVRNRFIDEIGPHGIVEQLYVEDVIYLSWEILRLRRCWTNIINSAFRGALEKILAELLRQPDALIETHESHAKELALDWFSDQKARSRALKILEQFGLDETAIEAEAIRNRIADLERLDKLLASRESRLRRALHGIAEYRTSLAQQLRVSSKRIIDGEVFAVEDTKETESSTAA